MNHIYTTSAIENLYNKPVGSVRRDIWRGKIQAVKSGNAWLIDETEMLRVYGNPEITKLYMLADEDYGDTTFAVSTDDIETVWMECRRTFDGYRETLKSFTSKWEVFDFDDLADAEYVEKLQMRRIEHTLKTNPHDSVIVKMAVSTLLKAIEEE